MSIFRGLNWAAQSLGSTDYYPNSEQFGRAFSLLPPGPSVAHSDVGKPKPESDTVASEISWVKIQQGDGYEVSRRDRTIKIILDRPKQGNALTLNLAKDLTSVFATYSSDDSVHRIVLTARGRYFCTGMHLQEDLFTSPAQRGSALQDLFRTIDTCPKTTIAVINGPAFGGGVGLAMVCDIRLVVETAYFCLSEAKLGLCPAIVSRYLVREWGISLVRMAMLTARKVQPHMLSNIGAIHEIAKDQVGLDYTLDKMLADLMLVAPQASASTKKLLAEVVAHDHTLDRLALDVFRDMFAEHTEARYGITQFREGNRNVNWDSVTIDTSTT
ncbi:3-hydroxymethyl-3-methylglutaryl-CoA lyase [Diaporthe helianthi]|uniref:3-hydroxymethyl-3-methylglutaryl-CoA lyase n=1 Tax=Diaporthe helianthi TaxID=158607 RepID=A0A2P5IF01_DIAHE|nr:3-hydroxymethyl-3-methylglutaryl-CoA lyase [Diaporthe helianthi]